MTVTNNVKSNATLVPNRAGAVVFNRAGEVLIISDLGATGKWVFPKGHIEKGETAEQAALREVKEESGVIAQFDTHKPVGYSAFVYKGENVVVEWWAGLAVGLDETVNDYDEPNWRDIVWVKPDEALQRLSFPSLRNVLRKAMCVGVEEKE